MLPSPLQLRTTNTQEKGSSGGYVASHLPSGMTAQSNPDTTATLFLKIFSVTPQRLPGKQILKFMLMQNSPTACMPVCTKLKYTS